VAVEPVTTRAASSKGAPMTSMNAAVIAETSFVTGPPQAAP
jgi:hypothetical protein